MSNYFLRFFYTALRFATIPDSRPSRRSRTAMSRPLMLALLLCAGVQQSWASPTPAATTTTLTVLSGGTAVASITHGATVALTASVGTSGAPVTTGQVNFCDATAAYCTDIHILGTAQLTSVGTAVLHLVPAVGSHSYKAVFVGTNSNTGSTSNALPLSVTGTYASTTNVTATGSAGAYSLTATVIGVGSSAMAPTGKASFTDTTSGGVSLGSAGLTSAGPAAFALANGPALSTAFATYSVGDFNNDGIPDLASIDNYQRFRVGLGVGDGTFHYVDADSQTLGAGARMVVADFNSDGQADLLLCSIGGGTTGLYYPFVTALLGNGDGTFRTGPTTRISGAASDVKTGDFNGDGIPDFVISTWSEEQVPGLAIFLGSGDGSFAVASEIKHGEDPLYLYPQYLATADFNGDGKLDVTVVYTYLNTVSIYIGNGDGTFIPGINVVSAPQPVMSGANTINSILAADMNQDGKMDLVVGGPLFPNVYLGKGDGTFQTPLSITTPTGSTYSVSSLSIGDFNGDGKPDFAARCCASTTPSANGPIVFLGNGDGTVSTTGPVDGIQAGSPTIADFNEDGLSDIAYPTINTAVATTDGIFFSQAGQKATATLTGVSPVGAGTHQVQASYPGDGVFAASTSATLGLTAQQLPTTLTLSGLPTSSTYGAQVVLTAVLSPYNSAGQSTDGEPITFTNGMTTIGTANLSSGAASLNVTSLPAGTNGLKATYSGDANLVASSGNLSFVVTQATPTVAWAPAASTLYTGQAVGAGFLNASSTVAGTFTYTYALNGGTASTLSASSILSVGSYTLTASFTPTDTTDYTSKTVTVSLTVKPGTLTVTPATLSRAFGLANPALGGTLAGAVNGDNFTVTGATVATATSPVGSYPITYTVTGANLANYTVNAPNGSLTITAATPAITLLSSSNPALVQNAVTFTATLTSPNGTPTGSVNFLDGTTPLGSGVVVNGVATFNVSTLTAGSHSVKAIYGGDGNFISVTSPVLTETIQDFALSLGTGSSSTLSGNTNGTVTDAFTLTPNGATFPAPVVLTLTGLPAGATYTFSPATIAAGASATPVTLSIQLPATIAQLDGPSQSRTGLASIGLAALLLPFSRRFRRRGLRIPRILTAALIVLLGAVWMMPLSGCAGGGSGSTSGSASTPHTYTLTVNATSGTLVHSTTLTLTVN